MHSIDEVVKQFEFRVSSLPNPIKGKIVKHDSAEGVVYSWSISHHYKPSAGAGVYYPSRVTCPRLAEAEDCFRAYAEAFVPDFQVVPNDHY